MPTQRTYPRIQIRLLTNYQVGGETAPVHLGMGLDLSMSGIRLSQGMRLEPGSEVLVTLSPPESRRLILKGAVVWCRESANKYAGFLSGIRWLDNDPDARDRLNALVTHPPTVPGEAPASPGSGSAQKAIPPWWSVRLVLLGLLLLVTLMAFLSLYTSTLSR